MVQPRLKDQLGFTLKHFQMGKPPAFQFYANDFMDATRMWDAFACGLYIRLLCVQWTHGSIPDDQRRIAKGAGCDLAELQREWYLIEPKFPICEDGTRKNARLEVVRKRQQTVSDARSGAANARWNSNANASANDNAKTKQRKVKVKEKIEVEREGGKLKDESFEKFWTAYERKGNRKSAEQEWQKISPEDHSAIMANVPRYNASKPDMQFRRDGERYLKHRVWKMLS